MLVPHQARHYANTIVQVLQNARGPGNVAKNKKSSHEYGTIAQYNVILQFGVPLIRGQMRQWLGRHSVWTGLQRTGETRQSVE